MSDACACNRQCVAIQVCERFQTGEPVEVQRAAILQHQPKSLSIPDAREGICVQQLDRAWERSINKNLISTDCRQSGVRSRQWSEHELYSQGQRRNGLRGSD